MSPNPQRLDAQLILHEGLFLKPYKDTMGFLTTGVGRNLDGNPLTPAEISYVGHNGRTQPLTRDQAIYLLHNDEHTAFKNLDAHCPWWTELDEVRSRVMVDLMFNMGWGKLGQFHHFLGDMQAEAFPQAADDLKNSLWYSQVGTRGKRLVDMTRTGKDYTA